MGKILIKNGKVWDGEKFYFANVLTDNGIIHSISPDINEDAEYTYDAYGKIVSVGLVDAHVHMRGLNKSFGIQAELSCIPFGVTSAADACGACGDKALLDSFMVKNVVFVPVEIRNNKACFETVEKKLEDYGEKASGLKVYFDAKQPEIKDIKPLCEVVEYAEKNNLIVMVHCSNSPVPMQEIFDTLRKDDILTHAYHGGNNNVSVDNFECIKIAQSRGVIIDAGFAGHIHTDFRVFEDAVKCGAVPDVISTDITRFSAYKRGGRYGMTMCMSVAREVGMSEENIFRAVTSTPARVLGVEAGRLFEGCVADLCVIGVGESFSLTDKEGNTVQSDNGYKCLLTVKNGQILYRY